MQNKMQTEPLVVLPLCLLLLASSSCLQKKNPAVKEITFSSQQCISLYGKQASTLNGELELKRGDFLTWKGDAELGWDVNIPTSDTYELYLIANIRDEADSVRLSFNTAKETTEFTLSPTKGPYKGERNFQRIKLQPAIILEQGKQTLSLSTSGVLADGILLDFRLLEL